MAAPGRISVPTVYSLCQCMRPGPASLRACSRVSAICQVISTRQSARLTTLPLFFAASSAKPHCTGSAARPSVDVEPMEITPVPYLPANVMPEGLSDDATTMGIFSCSGNSCSAASFKVNHSHS